MSYGHFQFVVHVCDKYSSLKKFIRGELEDSDSVEVGWGDLSGIMGLA